jgi:hypothetical protein
MTAPSTDIPSHLLSTVLLDHWVVVELEDHSSETKRNVKNIQIDIESKTHLK